MAWPPTRADSGVSSTCRTCSVLSARDRDQDNQTTRLLAGRGARPTAPADCHIGRHIADRSSVRLGVLKIGQDRALLASTTEP